MLELRDRFVELTLLRVRHAQVEASLCEVRIQLQRAFELAERQVVLPGQVQYPALGRVIDERERVQLHRTGDLRNSLVGSTLSDEGECEAMMRWRVTRIQLNGTAGDVPLAVEI